MTKEEKTYPITLENDKTLKQFFDRFYVISKDIECTKEQKEFLAANHLQPIDKNIREGINGYIVRRKNIKKLSSEEVEKIKNDIGSYRSKAKKYKVSIGTISKIMNNKY